MAKLNFQLQNVQAFIVLSYMQLYNFVVITYLKWL